MRSAPSTAVYINLLKGCIREKSLSYARHVYSHLVKHRSHPVCNGLLGDYVVEVFSTCGSLDEAYRVSQRLPRRSVFCWTSIISSYTNSGRVHEALSLYREMKDEGIEPNHSTFASLFKACGSIPHYEEGKKLHKLALKRGFASDAFVGTALMNMYNKFGNISEAESVFRDMSRRDIISWTTMLTLYVDNGHGKKALQLFREMQVRCGSALLDDRVFVVSLQACGILAEEEEALIVDGRSTKLMSLDITKALHADACQKGYGSNVYVCTTLVNTYGKCGDVSLAEEVFNGLSERNIVSWNAMFSTYVDLRLGERAFHLYQCMQKEQVGPDDVTFKCILQACSETGSLEFCKHVHFHIITLGYDYDPSVASTLIHGYGSCGSMVNAEATFHLLSTHDTVSWSAFISSHTGEGNCVASLNMYMMSQFSGVQPNEITFTAVLVACSHAGLVDEGETCFVNMSQSHGMFLDLEHYTCMVDIFGRAGHLDKAVMAIKEMPCSDYPPVWAALLGACRKWGYVNLGRFAFKNASQLHSNNDAHYTLMANIYSASNMKQDAEKVQAMRLKMLQS